MAKEEKPIGCGYCAHESTCVKRTTKLAEYHSNKNGIRDRFRNGGYTRYLAKRCKQFELAYGVANPPKQIEYAKVVNGKMI